MKKITEHDDCPISNLRRLFYSICMECPHNKGIEWVDEQRPGWYKVLCTFDEMIEPKDLMESFSRRNNHLL